MNNATMQRASSLKAWRQSQWDQAFFGTSAGVMPTAFTAPHLHWTAAPQTFPALLSQSPPHSAAALSCSARTASAHCLAPAVALAEMSLRDHLSLEWPAALPLSLGLLCKLHGQAIPRPRAWCLPSLPPSSYSCSIFPGLPGHAPCLCPGPWPFQIVAVVPEKGHP